MAGDEVGVEVGEEDVVDFELLFFGVAEILVDIALGVDDDAGAGLFVAEQIRGVREAA